MTATSSPDLAKPQRLSSESAQEIGHFRDAWFARHCMSSAMRRNLCHAFVVTLLVGSCWSPRKSIGLTQREAAGAAIIEACSMGYDRSGIVARIDDKNSDLAGYLRNKEREGSLPPTILEELRGEVYWAVYIHQKGEPEELSMENGLFVFVRRADGEILGWFEYHTGVMY